MTDHNSKFETARRITTIACAALLFAFFMPGQAQARGFPGRELPALEQFIAQVTNGDPDALRGAYVPGVLALPIVQQPANDANYVSPVNSSLTQFGMAQKLGNVGLLAHNYLAGGSFANMQLGDQVILVYGNARTEIFEVGEIHRYEALPNGLYRNLQTQEILRAGSLFAFVYGGDRRVTFQTCIARGADLNWGRLFVVASARGAQVAEAETAPGVVVAPPPPLSAAADEQVAPSHLIGWPLRFKVQSGIFDHARP
jgi:hypothetical protein